MNPFWKIAEFFVTRTTRFKNTTLERNYIKYRSDLKKSREEVKSLNREVKIAKEGRREAIQHCVQVIKERDDSEKLVAALEAEQ